MSLQLVFCVESNKRARTDNIYIKEAMSKYYVVGNDIKLSFVNMGGKSRYNAKEIIGEINRLRRDFKIGNTKVIYFIDTDYVEKDINQKSEYEKIQRFVRNSSYELVWFCHDVEEVFVGHPVSDGEKKDRAIMYKTKKEIERVNERNLSYKTESAGRSNLLLVLDQYLKRKK